MPNPDRPRLINYTPSRPFSAIPQYYHPISILPSCPGWYFCWTGPQADYRYWPGDWDGVSCWVELPEFVQRLLQKVVPTPL